MTGFWFGIVIGGAGGMLLGVFGALPMAEWVERRNTSLDYKKRH